SGEIPREPHFDPSGDPDLLPLQRWGVIVPEGPEGKRLLGLIEPPKVERQRQQDNNPVRVYEVPPVMSGSEAARWKREVYNDESVAEEDQPFYLLILGDMHQVSVHLQRVLGASCAVGRLAFRDDRGYEAYVD